MSSKKITPDQWEEISYHRSSTFAIKSVPEKIDQNQLAIMLKTLGLADQVAMIQRVNYINTTRLEVSLKSGYSISDMKRKINSSNIEINGNQISVDEPRPYKDLIKTTITKVLIFEAPYELPDKYLLQKLAPYGHLHTNEVHSHKIRGFDILNGVNLINFKDITTPIPTVIYVRGNKIKIKYEKQDRTAYCGICQERGHHRGECEKLKALVEEEINNPEASADPSTLSSSEIRKLLKKREEQEKLKEQELIREKIEAERRQKQKEDEERRKRFYEHRKRMAEANHSNQLDSMDDENTENLTPEIKKKRKKERQKAKRKQLLQEKSRTPDQTPKDTLMTSDNAESDSTLTRHDSSSVTTEEEVESNPTTRPRQDSFSDSQPTPGQRPQLQDAQIPEDDTYDGLSLHEPLSHSTWGEEVAMSTQETQEPH